MEKKQKFVWFAKRCALALAVAALCYLLFGVIGDWCMFRRVTGLPLPDLRHEPCLAVRSSAGFCRRLFLASAVLDRSAHCPCPDFFRCTPPMGPPRSDRLSFFICSRLGGADAFAVSPYPANDRRSRRHSAAPYGCALLNLKREVSFL